jgi:hypothetical protein
MTLQDETSILVVNCNRCHNPIGPGLKHCAALTTSTEPIHFHVWDLCDDCGQLLILWVRNYGEITSDL